MTAAAAALHLILKPKKIIHCIKHNERWSQDKRVNSEK